MTVFTDTSYNDASIVFPICTVLSYLLYHRHYSLVFWNLVHFNPVVDTQSSKSKPVMVLMILDSCSSRPEAVKNSTLITSQVLGQSLSPAQAENKGMASATGLTSAASDALPARPLVVAKQDVSANVMAQT